jgi:hypothetical protein
VNLWTPLISFGIAVVVALIGFWLALRQDEIRWLREKKVALYLDLLVEAYAEMEWIRRQLHVADMRNLFGDTDSAAAQEAVEQAKRDMAARPDTRLPPKDRAMLSARMDAFAKPSVTRAFNGVADPVAGIVGLEEGLVGPAWASARGSEVVEAWDRFRTLVRAELYVPEHRVRNRLLHRPER